MSALGHKRTLTSVRAMSALPPITDVGRRIQVSIGCRFMSTRRHGYYRVEYDSDMVAEGSHSLLVRNPLKRATDRRQFDAYPDCLVGDF